MNSIIFSQINTDLNLNTVSQFYLYKLYEGFLAEGWPVLVISSFGVLARISLLEEQTTVIELARRVFASIIVGIIAWAFLQELDFTRITHFVIYILIGLDAPSIIIGVIKTLNIFTGNIDRFIRYLKDFQSLRLPSDAEIKKTNRNRRINKPKK